MEINGENYSVIYDPTTVTVTCEGKLRLYGTAGYTDVMDLLNAVADQKPETITLNLHGLQFLNSSGISTLSKFVIRIRKHKASQLVIQGTHHFPWQLKSLGNLQRLMPSLKLEFD